MPNDPSGENRKPQRKVVDTSYAAGLSGDDDDTPAINKRTSGETSTPPTDPAPRPTTMSIQDFLKKQQRK